MKTLKTYLLDINNMNFGNPRFVISEYHMDYENFDVLNKVVLLKTNDPNCLKIKMDLLGLKLSEDSNRKLIDNPKTETASVKLIKEGI